MDITLCQAFADNHPQEAARVFERLPALETAPLLDALPAPTVVRIVDQLTPAAAAGWLTYLRPETVAALLIGLRTDRAAALLRQLDGPARTSVLAGLPHRDVAHLHRVLQYPDGSAGALMDPRVVTVADDVTVGDALARLRHSAGQVLSYVYVVDRAARLTGVVDLDVLMLHRPDAAIATLMRTPVVSLSAHASRATILAHGGWERFHTLPVVDDERFVGAIRYRTFRQLDRDTRHQALDPAGVGTVFALGELYWLSLSSLIEGVAAVASSGDRPGRDRREGHHDLG